VPGSGAPAAGGGAAQLATQPGAATSIGMGEDEGLKNVRSLHNGSSEKGRGKRKKRKRKGKGEKGEERRERGKKKKAGDGGKKDAVDLACGKPDR